MTQLDKRAKQLGANAVVNIVSYYQKNVMSSPTEFECHAGNIIAGVALRGEFVKIASNELAWYRLFKVDGHRSGARNQIATERKA